MKRLFPILMIGIVALTMFAGTGCKRHTHRSVVLLPWDRNVTVAKKSKRKLHKPGRKAVSSRSHNRAVRIPGR